MAEINSNNDLRPVVGKKLHPVNVKDLGMYAFYAAADGLDNLASKFHQKYVKFGFRDAEMHKAAQNGDKRAVVSLLVDGVDPSAPSAGMGVAPLARAITHHHNEVANILLNATYRRDPNRIHQPSTETGETFTHIAAKSENWTALKSLLRFNPDVNLVDHQGMSPISLVAGGGDASLLKSLVEKGGDPHTLDSSEMPVAFHVLMGHSNDKIAMLKVLKDAGANLTGKFGLERTSLLSIAAQSCSREVVEHLMLLPGMDINSLNDQGLSPLHFSTLNNNPGVTASLLRYGAQPNVLSKGDPDQGSVPATPLMIAAAKNNYEAVDALLDNKQTNILLCAPGTKDNALTVAQSRGHDDVVTLLQSSVRERVSEATREPLWAGVSPIRTGPRQ